jgi:hypothetical protein
VRAASARADVRSALRPFHPRTATAGATVRTAPAPSSARASTSTIPSCQSAYSGRSGLNGATASVTTGPAAAGRCVTRHPHAPAARAATASTAATARARGRASRRPRCRGGGSLAGVSPAGVAPAGGTPVAPVAPPPHPVRRGAGAAHVSGVPNASANAATVGKRSAGDLARARTIASSTCGGTVPRTIESGGTVSSRCRAIIACVDPAANGACPASIS